MPSKRSACGCPSKHNPLIPCAESVGAKETMVEVSTSHAPVRCVMKQVCFHCCWTSLEITCPSLTVSVLQGARQARQTAGPPVTRSAANQTRSGRAAMSHPSRTESGPAFRFTDRKANHDLEIYNRTIQTINYMATEEKRRSWLTSSHRLDQLPIP